MSDFLDLIKKGVAKVEPNAIPTWERGKCPEKCKNCGGTTFATSMQGQGLLVRCTKCGKEVLC